MSNICAECGAAIDRTGKPGRPRKRCAECGPAPGAPSTCLGCGAAFNAVGPAVYCSRACANQSTAKRRPQRDPADRRRKYHERISTTAGLTSHARTNLLMNWKAQRRSCTYCGELASTIDHAIPLIRGGTNYEGNLVPACRTCNSRKRDRLPIEYRLGRNASSTWQPRPDRPPRTDPKPSRIPRVCSCYICGAAFTARQRQQITCSPACSVEHSMRIPRERYRQRRGLPPTWNTPVGSAWAEKRRA